MKQINFKDKEYRCPEKWSECSLGMVVETQILDELIPNAPFVSVIAGYVGIPTQEITSASVEEINPIMEALVFINDDYKPIPRNEFELNGSKYSCPEDLRELRFDQWVSVNTILQNHKDSPVRGLAKILASVFIKENETLDSFDLQERSDEFLDLPLTTSRDIESFFLTKKKELEVYTQLSSMVKGQEEIIRKQLIETINIVNKRKERLSIFSPTRLVIGIYQRYLKSFQKGWEKYCNSSPISE